MRALVQKVRSGSVSKNEREIASIGKGLVILLGIKTNDTKRDVEYLVKKCLNLRIFNDGVSNRFSKSTIEINAEILVVSQFTLYGDCRKGRRPSFTEAGDAKYSKPLYDLFISEARKYGLKISSGEFGADMIVTIHNDGPVTLILES